VSEAKQTQDFVIENSDSESAEELIAKIDQYKSEIETKKLSIQSGESSVPVAAAPTETTATNNIGLPTHSTTVPVDQAPAAYQPIIKTPAPSTKPNDVEVVVATSEEEVVEDLEEVQEELEEIKKEIERKVPKNFQRPSSDDKKRQDKKKDDDREDERGSENRKRNDHD